MTEQSQYIILKLTICTQQLLKELKKQYKYTADNLSKWYNNKLSFQEKIILSPAIGNRKI